MDVDALEGMIQQDLDAGARPFAVVATAGTVATGAVDAMDRIADVCRRFGLWLHVDAAYGGPAVLADDLRPQLEGIDRADSIAFDPHKWLYTPHSGGCIVARDMTHLAESFATTAAYLRDVKERSGTGQDISMLGPQLSRGFQAFKVWVSLLAHGTAAYGRRISHDAALARYMGDLVDERPGLERMADVPLSICCFRYVPPDLPGEPGDAVREEYLDRLNEHVMTDMWIDGRVFISNAVLRGRFVLRACIVNFRTEAEHVELVLDVAEELGARLDAELRPEALRGT
jgi:glutamate/tyrosine decarboxylase-like PLP-dependent enzyme